MFDNVLHAFKAEKEKVLANKKSTLDECNMMLAICHKYLKKLKLAVLEEGGFKSKKQEVRFFKHIKPVILSNLFFYLDARPLEISFLNKCTESNKERLLEKIGGTDAQLQKNNEFLHYIVGGYTHLDKKYFTIQDDALIPGDNRIYFFDPEFSTSHSGLLAKILACQRLLPYLKSKIQRISEKDKISGDMSEGLQWTATKVDLVELIYALHLNRSIGHGKTQIKRLAKAFEKLFDIELPELYKVYSEIKHRQKSKTKFLDELMINMRKRIDQDC